MKHDVALKVAEALVEHLRPVCTRIEIAGSIRRLKPEVKDIEIVCIPDLTITPKRAPLEFGKPIPPSYKTELDQLIAQMGDDVSLDLNGDRMKKLFLRYAGIKCDLFINLPPAEWGVQLAIRTGSADFSHWLVTNRKYGGALPDGYFVKHQVVWDAGKIRKAVMPDDPNKALKLLTEENHLPMAEEAEFLGFCGLGWIEPREREAKWRK